MVGGGSFERRTSLYLRPSPPYRHPIMRESLHHRGGRAPSSSIALIIILTIVASSQYYNHDTVLVVNAFTSLIPKSKTSHHFFFTTTWHDVRTTATTYKQTNLHSSTINDEETISSSSSSSSNHHGATSPSKQIIEQFLVNYGKSLDEGYKWADEFGFTDNVDDADEDNGHQQQKTAEGAFYALFSAIRKMEDTTTTSTTNADADEKEQQQLLGLNGTPFYIPSKLLHQVESSSSNDTDEHQQQQQQQQHQLFTNYFHFEHLSNALEEDFLDAQRGSTDNRKGWKVNEVSKPLGSSFDDARMTLPQVKKALEVSRSLYVYINICCSLHTNNLLLFLSNV